MTEVAATHHIRIIIGKFWRDGTTKNDNTNRPTLPLVQWELPFLHINRQQKYWVKTAIMRRSRKMGDVKGSLISPRL